jgi:threonine dehydrogenase-like Zn-dependent dehydrogenase
MTGGRRAARCMIAAELESIRSQLDQIEEAYELFANQRDGVLKIAITP